MPNEETFPFTEISVKLCDGSSFTLDNDELAAALQYIPTQGYPPLLQVEIILLFGFSLKLFRIEILELAMYNSDAHISTLICRLKEKYKKFKCDEYSEDKNKRKQKNKKILEISY